MDLILINGKVFTMDKECSFSEAVAIQNGRIVKVGRNEDVLKLIDSSTQIIDLMNRMVIPGFNDSHVHLLNYGYSLNKIDLSSAKSIEEVIDISRRYIEEKKPKTGEWILGRGWNHENFKDKRVLTRHDLDSISTTNPISFTRICEHMTAANSKAIELAKVTSNTPQPEGGYFDTDENGEPVGMFRETGRYLIYDLVPDNTIEEVKLMILKAAKIASGFGVTSVQTDDFEALPSKDYKKVLTAYKELAEEGLLTVRIYEQCLLPEINRLKEFLNEGYVTGKGDEFFKIGPLKLLADGSLGGRTAYLTKPYDDDPGNTGVAVFTQDELDELVLTAHEAGMQILAHAIGDGAMYMCFDSFDKANKIYNKDDPRFGIVHVQITDEVLLKKFKIQNVIANLEPSTLNDDIPVIESRVGKARSLATYNFRTLFDSGVNVTISSDCPVNSLNPMINIYSAVTRKLYNGYPEGGWLPKQKLTLDQVLYGFTMGSAYASFEEKTKGSIEEGKYADIVVLSENIYEVDENDLNQIKVDLTILGGKIVYKR